MSANEISPPTLDDPAGARFGDVQVTLTADHIATVEIQRPPNNFFDVDLIKCIADAYEMLDDSTARVIVLRADGKHFCAGADFVGRNNGTVPPSPASELYKHAIRLFESSIPVVAEVQGAAIGGGLGLACSADFRVATPETKLSANFARLGFHHGFGLSVTLPEIVGKQRCLDLLYSGRRIGGVEAHGLGLCDRLVDAHELRDASRELALSVAESAPLAVRAIRVTMRGDLADRIRQATVRELSEQDRLKLTDDWAEGVRATAERRPPNFVGR